LGPVLFFTRWKGLIGFSEREGGKKAHCSKGSKVEEGQRQKESPRRKGR